MDCSMPSFPVLHYFPNSLFAQTHVHWVGDVIQLSYPLSHTPPPAFSLSQHKNLFHWVGFSNQVARPKYWSFSFGISPSNEYLVLIPLRLTGLISLLSKGLSRIFSSTTVLRNQFFSSQPFLSSRSHIHIWLLEKKNIALTIQTFDSKVISVLFNTLSRLSLLFFQGASIF